MSLSFDPASHTYRLSGVVVPSVTQVLKHAGLTQWYPPNPVYRQRGDAIHKAAALMMQGRLATEADGSVSLKTDPRIRGYVESSRKWVARTGFQPLLIEQGVYSAQWRVAGSLDYFGILDGKPTILDLKSGEPGKPSAQLQTAGYAVLLKECMGHSAARRIALRLSPGGDDPEPFEYHNMAEDVRYFLSAVSLYHLRAQHGLLEKEK